MEDLTALSKSLCFVVEDGTIAIAAQLATRPDPLELLPGSIVDNKYRIISLLARGGMGAIFKAHHLGLAKDVALKTFSHSQLTEEARLRFQREAQAIGKLAHRHIIQVFDYGLSEGDVPYYTMEFLSGESLADRIGKAGPLRPADALKLFLQVSEGLAVAHSKGIIHRDLKPANLFIERVPSPRGAVDSIKIVDFGIAALTDQSAEAQKLTTSGAIFGSPLYMSPEQAMGDVVTVSSDVYSFGCALFESLTGKPPFRGANALETLMLHQKEKAPTLQERAGGREFHPALEKAVAAMLAKSPEDRPASMEQVASTLARIKPDQTFKLKRIERNESPDSGAPVPGAAMEWGEDKNGGAVWSHGWMSLGGALAAVLLLIGAGFVAVRYSVIFHRSSNADYSNSASAGQANNQLARASLTAPSPVHTTPASTAGDDGKLQPQPNTAAAKLTRPRREIIDVDGKRMLRFTFSEGLKLGDFIEQIPPYPSMSAVGQVSWPEGVKDMGFVPSAEFLQEPRNFDVFEKDDLFGVFLVHGEAEAKDNNLLKHLSHLTRLHFLDLEQCAADDGCLPSLMPLKKLVVAKFINVDISGSTLAKLPQLRQMTILTFNHVPDVSGLLRGLQGSRAIQELYLDGETLTRADVKLISTLPNLTVLQANDSHLKPDDLELLTGLKSLHKLHAIDCRISGSQIEVLRTLVKNGLRDLCSSSIGLSPKDERMIRELLPNARLENRNAAKLQDVPPEDWQKLPGSFDPEIK